MYARKGCVYIAGGCEKNNINKRIVEEFIEIMFLKWLQNNIDFALSLAILLYYCYENCDCSLILTIF